MKLVPEGQTENEKRLDELGREVTVSVHSFVKLISKLQDEVSKHFIEEYGTNGKFKMSSLPKLARIMSKYAASDNYQKLRRYPKAIQKHFITWQALRKAAMNSSRIQKQRYAVIPSKLSFYYFYNGELCKAVVCLLDYIDLIPDDTVAVDAAIRWLMFLGETELAERKMSKWKMGKGSEDLWTATKLAISYTPAKEMKLEIMGKLLEIRDMIKNDNENSFPKYEVSSYVSWLCSTLCNVQVGTTLEGCEFPDRLSQLEDATTKAEAIMRKRVPGLAAYNFNNKESASIWPFLEGKRPGTPIEYIHLGSTVAWQFEIRREWALINVSSAQGCDALSVLLLNFRIALKSASLFRILQAANNMTFYSIVIEEPESLENTKIMKASCINLISPNPIVVHFSTPKKDRAPSREHTALPGQKSSNNSPTMEEVVDQFGKLELLNKQKFHPITSSCGCNICLQYPYSSTFAAEYMFSYCLNSNFSQISMQHFDKAFVAIRERDMKYQAYMHREHPVKPRPNVIQSEIFGLCSIQWMIRKVDAKEPVDEESMAIHKNAMKIARYLKTRSLDQSLALKHLGRQYEFPLDRHYSWMQPVVRKPLVEDGIECAVGTCRAVSPFGSRARIPIASRSKPDLSRLEALKLDLRQEYTRHIHILYKDWRCRIFSYVGRTFPNPWEAAYGWAESTMIGARNAVQSKLRKCRKGLVTISGPERFKKCVKEVPDDMTIVSIAMADNKQIFLIKLHADREPIIMPLAHYSQAMELMDKFTFLLAEDRRVTKDRGDLNRAEYWERRRSVDARLGTFVGEVQKNFLDVSANLLMPSGRLGPAANELALTIQTASRGGILLGEAKDLVYLSQFTEKKPWTRLFNRFCEMRIHCDAQFKEDIPIYHRRSLEALKKDKTERKPEECTSKKYTYLVICPELSQFCWECLPIFENFPYVVRQVSIHSVFSQLEAMRNKERTIPLQIDVQNAYYVLDPENNLQKTKRSMLDLVNKFNWEGTVGSAPKPSEIGTVLEEYDAFLYYGHGSGSQVMPTTMIKQSTCNAVSILMGCSSVRTVPQGYGFDGKSALLDYTMAKCPLIVGCLWTVTDGEIDIFLTRMVDDCFERTQKVEEVDKLRQLAEAMHASRSKVKFKYLTGAAVVMYGFPVVAKQKQTEPQSSSETSEENTAPVSTKKDDVPKGEETAEIVAKVKPVPKTPLKTPRASAATKTPRTTRSVRKAQVFNEEEEQSVPTPTRVLRSSTRTPSRSHQK